MSRNVFISFLGTNDYEQCRYVINGDFEMTTKFVQEAVISYRCIDWTDDDRILVFTTDGAKNNNWGELYSALNARELAPVIEAVMIPDEISEKTMWKVFKIIFDKLQKEDKILVDITHGFRSSPMLLLTLINYSSFLKDTSVDKIYYGAYTAMSTLNVDYAPVWDLTDFILLHEWTLGANEYINYGQPERIASLAKRSAIPYIREDHSKVSALKITNFASSICRAANMFSSVRGISISSAELLQTVIYNSEEVGKVDIVEPLKPFMSKTIDKFKGFNPDDVLNFLPAVKYCIDHALIQQGITFLQEGIISYALSRSDLPWCTIYENERKSILKNREMLSGVLNFIAISKRGKKVEWDWTKYPIDVIQRLQNDSFCMAVANTYTNISEYRNDINHGGYICPKGSNDFMKMLKKGYDLVKNIVGH